MLIMCTNIWTCIGLSGFLVLSCSDCVNISFYRSCDLFWMLLSATWMSMMSTNWTNDQILHLLSQLNIGICFKLLWKFMNCCSSISLSINTRWCDVGCFSACPSSVVTVITGKLLRIVLEIYVTRDVISSNPVLIVLTEVSSANFFECAKIAVVELNQISFGLWT